MAHFEEVAFELSETLLEYPSRLLQSEELAKMKKKNETLVCGWRGGWGPMEHIFFISCLAFVSLEF